MLAKPPRKQLQQAMAGGVSLCFALYALLSPEFFRELSHELVFHKKGFEINHVHADFSLHAFFKHRDAPSKKPGIRTARFLQVVAAFPCTASFTALDPIIHCAFLTPSLLVAPVSRNFIGTTFFSYSARAPPLI